MGQNKRTKYPATDLRFCAGAVMHLRLSPLRQLLSACRKYFSRNIPTLSSACRVYALDLRFHGDSDSPSHGHHVARLAADLNDFLTCLNLERVVVVGTSLVGCCATHYFVPRLLGFPTLLPYTLFDVVLLEEKG